MFPNHQDAKCERIELMFSGRLSPADETDLEQHLETCALCRDQLRISAAEDPFWQEAARHLTDDRLDDEPAMTDWSQLLESREKLGSVWAAERSLSGSGERVDVLRIADYLDPTDDPRMLGRFGGYEIAGVVGCGGMGVVLKGFELSLERYVAIKVLAPHLAASGAARRRFAREAKAAAAVLHENVVAIHRVSEANGLPYLVMPYIPGDSLQQRLDQEGPLPLEDVLRIGRQIAAGLAAAHQQGLVHRDIKPGNILLDKGVERVTLTDFGLARAADDASLTRSGVITGTPLYMSPEQARGEPLDGRSDLFSLGSVLYATVTGRPPFRADSLLAVLQRIMQSNPRPIRQIVPEVPQWFCEIVAQLHAKDPKFRFQSAGEVAELLGGWIAHLQQPSVVPAPPRLAVPNDSAEQPPPERHRIWPTAVASGAVIILLVASLSILPLLLAGFLSTTNGPPPGTTDEDPVVAAQTTAKDEDFTILLDERTLVEEIQQIHRRLVLLESQLFEPAGPDADQPRRSADELLRHMDWLSEQLALPEGIEVQAANAAVANDEESR